jgi:hypothetical protein
MILLNKKVFRDRVRPHTTYVEKENQLQTLYYTIMVRLGFHAVENQCNNFF